MFACFSLAQRDLQQQLGDALRKLHRRQVVAVARSSHLGRTNSAADGGAQKPHTQGQGNVGRGVVECLHHAREMALVGVCFFLVEEKREKKKVKREEENEGEE